MGFRAGGVARLGAGRLGEQGRSNWLWARPIAARRGAGRGGGWGWRGGEKEPSGARTPAPRPGRGVGVGRKDKYLKVGTAARERTAPAVSVLRQPRPGGASPPTHPPADTRLRRGNCQGHWLGPLARPNRACPPTTLRREFPVAKGGRAKNHSLPYLYPPPPPSRCPLFRATAQAQLQEGLASQKCPGRGIWGPKT